MLCIASQVGHTKECDSIDSETKFVKRNTDHYHTVRKHFWFEQSTLARTAD